MTHTVKRFFNIVLDEVSVSTIEVSSYNGSPSQDGYITFQALSDKIPDALALINKLATTRNRLFPEQRKSLVFRYGFFNPETSTLIIHFYSDAISHGDKQKIFSILSSIIHAAARQQNMFEKPVLPWIREPHLALPA